jgi:hypothetical protein
VPIYIPVKSSELALPPLGVALDFGLGLALIFGVSFSPSPSDPSSAASILRFLGVTFLRVGFLGVTFVGVGRDKAAISDDGGYRKSVWGFGRCLLS